MRKWGVRIQSADDWGDVPMAVRGMMEEDVSPNCCASVTSSADAWIPASSKLIRRGDPLKDIASPESPPKAPAGPSHHRGGGVFATVTSASKYKPADAAAVWEQLTTSRAVKTSQGGSAWGGPPSRDDASSDRKACNALIKQAGGDIGDALHERMRRLDSLMSQAGTSHAHRPMASGQETAMMQGRSSAFALISHSHTIAADSRSAKAPSQCSGSYSHPQDHHVVPRSCSVPASESSGGSTTTTTSASAVGKSQYAGREEGRGVHMVGLGGAEGPSRGLTQRRAHSNTEW